MLLVKQTYLPTYPKLVMNIWYTLTIFVRVSFKEFIKAREPEAYLQLIRTSKMVLFATINF